MYNIYNAELFYFYYEILGYKNVLQFDVIQIHFVIIVLSAIFCFRKTEHATKMNYNLRSIFKFKRILD